MEEILKIKSMLYAAISEVEVLERKLNESKEPVSVVSDYKKPEGSVNDFKQKQVDFKALIGKAGREMEQCKNHFELKKVFQKYNEQLKTSTKYSALAKKNWERCSN